MLDILIFIALLQFWLVGLKCLSIFGHLESYLRGFDRILIKLDCVSNLLMHSIGYRIRSRHTWYIIPYITQITIL